MTAEGKFVVVLTVERDEAMKLDDLVASARDAGNTKATRQSVARALIVEAWGESDFGSTVPGTFARAHGIVPRGGR